jgi:signal transduction histidine kinase
MEDGRTAERVREALAAGSEYKFDGIRVAAGNGVIQLSGFVNTSAQRNRAGEVALKVVGVNLRPSMLDDLGLEPALRWYTKRQAALAGLQAEVRVDPLEQRLDQMIETECFRIAQEALTNVVKHARARTVTVELTKNDDDEQLHLSVRDDGVGFDVAGLREQAVRGASLGLLSMEERATLAGGGLEYDSTPGQGTEVHAWFPLKWAHPAVLIGDI